MKKRSNNFFVYVLIILVFYLLYQLLFTWENDFDDASKEAILPNDEVVFLTVTEKFYGMKKASFNYLDDSLETWKFDRKNKEVSLKFDSQLPKDKTQVMVIYDRGFNSFEKYSEVFSITSFPYIYTFKNKPFITVYQIEEDGTIYFDFEGKKIKLKANDSHYSWDFEGFQLSKIKITNHGIYKKEQFKKMEEQKNRKNKKNR